MNALTFNGFIKSYMVRISGRNTTSISLLCTLIEENPRLEPILVTYCHSFHKVGILIKRCRQQGLPVETFSNLNKKEFMASLENYKLGYEYEKIYDAFLRTKNRISQERQLISKIRNNVIKIISSKGISKYSIYKELGLNPGNINCWIKNNDSTKVNLQTALKISEYLEACNL